ncbi:MAG: tRNA uridine-5-carboxymethylaminomethyl(34) synthesis GTPase MnmE [Candidatus Riflebacteria bacterium]|nr:tRNA uridine-5-carboxymethylaminomethyl(34) synthesis GTPase MnmE [Candidatus Riflebacteria bacterium]
MGTVRDPADGEVVDQVVVTTFPAPHSFTGEDVAEISAHGNPVVLGRVLGVLLRGGARAAEAGEFARRAFLNGKLDLLGVEAMAQVLAAATPGQARVAANQLEGLPTRRLSAIRARLLDHHVRLEATLNFPEDAIEEIDERRLARDLAGVLGDLERFAAAARHGGLVAGGLPVVLLGRPNTGKSSLLNALLGRERAIVTEIPGTTRDTLEETLTVGDLPVKLIDTAGLRAAADRVEALGMARTRAALDGAFLALPVYDGAEPLGADDREVARVVREAGVALVSVVNKADLPRRAAVEELGPGPVVRVSALTGEGVPDLLAAIRAEAGRRGLERLEELVLLGAQQSEALERARQAVRRALDGLGSIYHDMLSVELEEAIRQLGLVTGEDVDPHTLDRIFERFCIGK